MDFAKQNILPLFLATIGIFFILAGIIQLISSRSPEKDLIFEAGPQVKREIIIDVQGAVMSPGVYSLTPEARMVDALAKAGGLSEDADRVWVEKNINLAQIANDGLKIYIPRVGEQGLQISSDKININTASEAELEGLQGIGPATASKIIERRPYSDVLELVSKKVVSQNAYSAIKDKITAY
jgi:competence protein ComEA